MFNDSGGGEISQVAFFTVAGAWDERLPTPLDKLVRLEELSKSSCLDRELDDNDDDERRPMWRDALESARGRCSWWLDVMRRILLASPMSDGSNSEVLRATPFTMEEDSTRFILLLLCVDAVFCFCFYGLSRALCTLRATCDDWFHIDWSWVVKLRY